MDSRPMADMEPAKTPPPPPWYKTPQARRYAAGLVGVLGSVLCPFIPWPPVQMLCKAVTGYVATLPVAPELHPGQMGCAGEEVCDDVVRPDGSHMLSCRCTTDAGAP